MLPESLYDLTDNENTALQDEEAEMPSLTYRMDFQTRRIIGRAEGLDAVIQAVRKLMQTERFAYPIYDDNYGVELESLIGRDRNFVESVIEQRITEALTQDERIVEITNFEIVSFSGDTMTIQFTVVSIYGDFNYAEEVL